MSCGEQGADPAGSCMSAVLAALLLALGRTAVVNSNIAGSFVVSWGGQASKRGFGEPISVRKGERAQNGMARHVEERHQQG